MKRAPNPLHFVKTTMCPTLALSFQPGLRVVVSGCFVRIDSEPVCIRNQKLLNLFCCLTFTPSEREVIGFSQFTISLSARSLSGSSIGLSYYASRPRRKKEGALTQQMSFLNTAATGQPNADLVADFRVFHFDRCCYKFTSERFFLVVEIFTNFNQRPGENHRLFARTESEAVRVKDATVEMHRIRKKK